MVLLFILFRLFLLLFLVMLHDWAIYFVGLTFVCIDDG